jgi:hypothetical protein
MIVNRAFCRHLRRFSIFQGETAQPADTRYRPSEERMDFAGMPSIDLHVEHPKFQRRAAAIENKYVHGEQSVNSTKLMRMFPSI